MLMSVQTDSDKVVFAAPKPSRYVNFLTLLHPLTYQVWIASVAAMGVVSAATCVLSRVGERWFGSDLSDGSSADRSVWSAFCTLISQSITNEKHVRSTNSNPLR
jgi:hypothetical protein